MARRRNQPEELLQRSVVEWLGWQYPNLLYFAVPNGGGRSKAEAGILKATGVKSGVADLAFCWKENGIARIGFIELKAPETEISRKGVQSENQKIFEKECDVIGAPYAVAWSIDEVDVALNEWGAV